MVECTAIVHDSSNHTIIIDKHLFGLETAHGVAGATDLRHIKADLTVVCREMSPDAARAEGAIGLFGNKYGDIVKVYSMGDFSKEICGGPHASHTGALGGFKILKEESSSRGVRRIKAVLVKDNAEQK